MPSGPACTSRRNTSRRLSCASAASAVTASIFSIFQRILNYWPVVKRLASAPCRQSMPYLLRHMLDRLCRHHRLLIPGDGLLQIEEHALTTQRLAERRTLHDGQHARLQSDEPEQ